MEFTLTNDKGESVHLTVVVHHEFHTRYSFTFKDPYPMSYLDAEGAQRLINLCNNGYKFSSRVPAAIKNALIQPAEELERNRKFIAYANVKVENDLPYFIDDYETYYHEPVCDCNAPLIESSYCDIGDNEYASQIVVHYPTPRLIFNYEGKIVRAYLRGVKITPQIRTKSDDEMVIFDDLRLICSSCGKTY